MSEETPFVGQPYWNYTMVFSTGNAPDLTQVNSLCQSGGWQLIQLFGGRGEGMNQREWVYILGKQATGP